MPSQQKDNQDLGLGERVIEENRSRFLNRDGSFNVRRKGIFERGSFSWYHWILSISWFRFFTFLLASYLFGNIIFTALYLLCGNEAFATIAGMNFLQRAGTVFFFSVHALTTVGASDLEPTSALAKILFSLEAMTGLLGLAVIAGIIFARFSNPAVKIIFSRHAVIAPYKNITGFMVRIVNGRSNELINLSATLTIVMADENGKRRFHQLELERDNILVFPLNWTLVHPITPHSPLYGLATDELAQREPEFLIGISAVDQDLSKTVYARHSYVMKEVEVGSRFKNIFERASDGALIIDPKRIHETESTTVNEKKQKVLRRSSLS